MGIYTLYDKYIILHNTRFFVYVLGLGNMTFFSWLNTAAYDDRT